MHNAVLGTRRGSIGVTDQKSTISTRPWALLNDLKHIEANVLSILTIWLCLQPP